MIVTNLSRPAERVVAFYNQRGNAEQYIKEGKNAIKWTRLSCRKFRDNALRHQLHALAYNLADFTRTPASPKEVEHWSLTTLREKPVMMGAKVVRLGRYVTFQLAEVAVPRALFQKMPHRRAAAGPFAAMTAAHPVASRSPDGTGVCCAGRSVPPQCEMVTGPGFSPLNQPDQKRATASRDGPGPNSRSDAHCATIVGNWEEPSGESRISSLEDRTPKQLAEVGCKI